MKLIIILILGHCLSSFTFLPEHLAYNRKFNKLLLLICSFIWASTIWLILEYYGFASWYDFVNLMFFHAVVSGWRLSRKNKKQQFRIYLFLEWTTNVGLIYLAYKY